jgi:hypothetical protein
MGRFSTFAKVVRVFKVRVVLVLEFSVLVLYVLNEEYGALLMRSTVLRTREYYPPNATRVELYVVEPYWGSTAGHEYYNLESRLSPTNESGMCMLKFNSRLP